MNRRLKAVIISAVAILIVTVIVIACFILPMTEDETIDNTLPESVSASMNDGYDVSRAEVDRYIDEMKISNQWNDDQWTQYLDANSETQSSFESKISIMLAKRHILRQWAQDEGIGNPSADDIQAKVEENKMLNDVLAGAEEQRESAIDELLIEALAEKRSHTDNTAALSHINNMRDELNGNKDISVIEFGNMDETQKFLDSGNRANYQDKVIYEGLESMGTFPNIVADAVSQIPPNSTSDIIEQNGRYYIVVSRDAVQYPDDGFTSIDDVPEVIRTELITDDNLLGEAIGEIRRELDEKVSSANINVNISE